MNGAYLHLLVNHLPVVGTPACFLLLAAGLRRRSRDLLGAGFVGLVLVALLAFAAHQTGHAAARFTRGIPEIARERVHEHDEAADWGLWTSLIAGALGAWGLWSLRITPEAPTTPGAAAAVAALFVSTVLARVAHTGGLIRHPEAAGDFQPPAAREAPPKR